MIVNGHTIPKLLCDMLADGQLCRAVGSWQLRAPCDYYGQFLETEIGCFHATPSAIETETRKLPSGYPIEESFEIDEFASEPGHIPYITDFSSIVEFATAGDGSPFCLDYRDHLAPSVIWWDDVYWRRLAPTFDQFIMLFDLSRP